MKSAILLAVAVALPSCLSSCTTATSGEKQFFELNKQQWGNVAVEVGAAVIAASVNQAALSYAQRQKLDAGEIGAAALNAGIRSGVIAYTGQKQPPAIAVTPTK